jgi:hypothetical protein
VHADLRWTTQGQLSFDVISVTHRYDLAAQDLAAPPATLGFTPSPPPQSPAELLAARTELQAFRTIAIELPPPPGHEGADPAGMTLVNSTDELRVAWIDGVPAAWVAPGARLVVPFLLHGRYAVQWRTFLGDAWDPPSNVVVPGVSEAGRTAP